MARSGLYKSDVQRARDALLAQGKHPSLDAVRIALGNTGSKSTIHRYLRELDEEEGPRSRTQVATSEALQDLVNRLAARLHEEAEARIEEAQQRFNAQLQERDQAIAQLRQEADGLSTQLQRTETALQAEREAHGKLGQQLAARNTQVAQLEERIAGLMARVAEHETHAQSLEDKHAHAREALEHYRTSVREQRDQDQRRHEQQLQELQLALRQANEVVTSKNHELLQLNRENGQWLERHSRLERDLAQTRQAHEGQQAELDALRMTAAEHQALQALWRQDSEAIGSLQTQLTLAHEDLGKERERREAAEAQALRLQGHQQAIDHLLEQLRQGAGQATAPEKSKKKSGAE